MSVYQQNKNYQSVIYNRPEVTKVAVLYVVIGILAVSTFAVVFYLLLKREADIIKAENGGFVEPCK